MLRRQKRVLTAEQFFDEYAGADEKYELIDGEAWMMAGGTRDHAAAATRIIISVGNQLAGTGCQPLNSDMGLQINVTNVRYPDVTIYCDPRDLGPEGGSQRGLQFPAVVFEVLSPSTQVFDRGGKVGEYKRVASIVAIVLVDLETRVVEVHERGGPGLWLHREVTDGDPLVLGSPPLTLTAAEIFGR